MDGATSLGQTTASQSVITAICLLSLVGKRFVDLELRPWKVWFFDSSKQVIQALMDHLIIVGLSKAFYDPVNAEADLCNWYWVNTFVDSTMGVLISLVCLRAIQCGYRTKCVRRPDLARCGDYGDPPDLRVFLRQLCDWLAISALRRILTAAFAAGFRPELFVFAVWLLGWLEPYPIAKFLTVAVFSPLALGVFALWTTDGFLRANRCSGLGGDQARERLISEPAVAVASAYPLEDEEEEIDRLVSFEEWKQRGISAVFGGPPQQASTELASRSSSEPSAMELMAT